MDRVKTLRCASDKSISHRSAILSSIASGKTTIKNYLFAQDTLNTLAALKKLGVRISIEKNMVTVESTGKYLKEPDDCLNFGNSGTGIRLISGVLSGQNFLSILSGDDSLRKRPMKRITEPLTIMGAKIYSRKNYLAPLAIIGQNELNGIKYISKIASAQVKSAILMAGLYTTQEVEFSEPALSRNHTEIMLKAFGVDIESNDTTVKLGKNRNLTSNIEIDVGADISACAFFMVFCALKETCECLFIDCNINPTRIGILKVFDIMNIQYEIVNKRVNFGEEVADILVKHSKEIKPFYIDQQLLASLIDEIPILSIAALFANGKSILKNAKELRVKESDRIKSIVENMRNLGVEIEEFEDGFALNPIRNLKKTYINTHFDHRIAMSFSILKSLGYELEISETKSPETSYPTFFEHLRYLET